MAYRPVIRAARLGVHCASTLKLSSRIPSAASWSIRGVGAPRRIPPPYTPGSLPNQGCPSARGRYLASCPLLGPKPAQQQTSAPLKEIQGFPASAFEQRLQDSYLL